MDPDIALARLVQVEAQIARLHAVQAELLVAVADPAPRIDEYLILDPRPGHDEEKLLRIEDAVREEIAAALRWSPATAQSRIDAARLLHGPLSATRDALAAGEITHAHARIVVDAVERFASRLERDTGAPQRFARQCDALQQRVLPVARRNGLARTRSAARRAVERIDAAGQLARRQAARRARDVWVGAECDGIAPLVAHLDATTARAVLAAVQSYAATPGDDARSAGERRADALVDLLLGPATPVQVTAQVQVTRPWSAPCVRS